MDAFENLKNPTQQKESPMHRELHTFHPLQSTEADYSG